VNKFSGYLLREVKEATGVGIIDSVVNETGIRETLSKRWFLLTSSKPIVLLAFLS
jgi:hypothetical protein